jgi:hypothetical protein
LPAGNLMGILLPIPSNTIKNCLVGSHLHGHSVIKFYYLPFTVNVKFACL